MPKFLFSKSLTSSWTDTLAHNKNHDGITIVIVSLNQAKWLLVARYILNSLVVAEWYSNNYKNLKTNIIAEKIFYHIKEIHKLGNKCYKHINC